MDKSLQVFRRFVTEENSAEMRRCLLNVRSRRCNVKVTDGLITFDIHI